MPSDPASRFQLVDVPVRNPGTCLFTKSPDGPLIDTGLDFGLGDRPRFAGRIYISVPIVREMAMQAGLVDAFNEWAEAEIERAYHRGYQDGVRENVEDVDDLVEQLHAAADRLGGVRDGGDAERPASPLAGGQPEVARANG